MRCKNCGTNNAVDALACAKCDAKFDKTVPSSITVNLPSRKDFDDEDVEQKVIPKGLLAALITMGVLLVAGVIAVAVLLVTQPNARAAVGSAPTASQTVMPSATPSPTPVPTPAATPVPTTAPENSDDFSSIFETPTNEIIEGSQ